MKDEFEKRLEDLYGSLNAPARRVEARWKAKALPRVERGSKVGWIGAGIAAAAAILLMILALRSEEKPAVETFVKAPAPIPVQPPAPVEMPRPAPVPVVPKPAFVETPRPEVPPTPIPPKSAPVDEPKTVPVPPAPVPSKKEEPAPTRVARAVAVLREIEGSFDLVDRSLRGKQKDMTVGVGDRLRAASLVKITLADDRVVLLSPRTVVEFRPEEKRQSLFLEQGELLADLIGPGPEVRIVTRSCEITPLGTVFGVKAEVGKVMILVEKGRVEVQGAKGRATLRAAESLQAADDGSLGAPAPADFKSLSWTRGHRAPEVTLFADDFSKPGAWTGDVEKGAIKAVPKPGGGAIIHIDSNRPLFEIPVRGSISLACMTDRASKLKVQIFAPELRTTYKVEVPLNRGSVWRPITLNFDDFAPSDKTRAPARIPPGSPITDLLLMYGEEEERGTFWVDSIRVTEVRP